MTDLNPDGSEFFQHSGVDINFESPALQWTDPDGYGLEVPSHAGETSETLNNWLDATQFGTEGQYTFLDANQDPGYDPFRVPGNASNVLADHAFHGFQEGAPKPGAQESFQFGLDHNFQHDFQHYLPDDLENLPTNPATFATLMGPPPIPPQVNQEYHISDGEERAASEEVMDLDGGPEDERGNGNDGGAIGLPRERRPRAKPAEGIPESEWKKWKTKIADLYIKQDKTLSDVRQILKDDCGFDASLQMYKDKFREWNFKKNLPRQWTDKLSRLADARQPKDTVFQLGPMKWTADQIRKKKGRGDFQEEQDSPVLPKDLIVRTPSLSSIISNRQPPNPTLRSWAPSNTHRGRGSSQHSWLYPPATSAPHRIGTTLPLPPLHAHTAAAPLPWLLPTNNHIRQIASEVNSSLSFRFNGKSVADLESQCAYGQKLAADDNLQMAIIQLREALAGLQELLGPTHRKTVDTAYKYVDVLHRYDKLPEADSILNWITASHIAKYGLWHDDTRKNYVKTISILRGFSRNDDAELVVSRLLDSVKSNDKNIQPPLVSGGKGTLMFLDSTTEKDLDAIFGELQESEQVDSQLHLTGVLIDIAPDKAERFKHALERIISFLKKDHAKGSTYNIIQLTQAYHLMGRLHIVGDRVDDLKKILRRARKPLEMHVSNSEHVSMDLLREARKLAFLHPEGAGCNEILELLADCLESRLGVEGSHIDCVILEFVIHVGVAWQQKSWEMARPWIERAYVISLKIHGPRHAKTSALDSALENGRFDLETHVLI